MLQLHAPRLPPHVPQVRDVLRAGTDVDCTSFVGQHAQSALDQKLITLADIDARLAKLFRVRVRLQHFDPPGPLQAIPPSAVCSDYAKALAREGVSQGATLLKNLKWAGSAAALPLSAATLRSVAVLGPNANLSKAVAGYYGGNSCDGIFPNMVDAIAASGTFSVTTAAGLPSVTSTDTSAVAAAAALAKAADVTVLVLGTDLTVAREGHDAVDLSFSSGQLALLEAAAAASAAPLIVLILSAVPLDITPLLEHPKVGALLHLGQPSVQTAGAADVIFGAVSPAGTPQPSLQPAHPACNPAHPACTPARARSHHPDHLPGGLPARRLHLRLQYAAQPLRMAAARLPRPRRLLPARDQPRPHAPLLHGQPRRPLRLRSLVHHLRLRCGRGAACCLPRTARRIAAAALRRNQGPRLPLDGLSGRCRPRDTVRRTCHQHGHGRRRRCGARFPVLAFLCSLPCARFPVLASLCSLPCARVPVLASLCSLPCAVGGCGSLPAPLCVRGCDPMQQPMRLEA